MAWLTQIRPLQSSTAWRLIRSVLFVALFVVLHLNVAWCVAPFDNVLQCSSVCRYSDTANAVQHCMTAYLALCSVLFVALFVALHLNEALCVAQWDNVVQCSSVRI